MILSSWERFHREKISIAGCIGHSQHDNPSKKNRFHHEKIREGFEAVFQSFNGWKKPFQKPEKAGIL